VLRLRACPVFLLALATLASPAWADAPSAAAARPEQLVQPAQPAPDPGTSSRPVLDEPIETPINVTLGVPTGLVIAYKPQVLSVRLDSGAGSQFGSDKLQLGRGLVGFTGRLIPGKQYLARVELEGGQFQSDSQGLFKGSDGYDLVLHLLAGAATRVSEGVNIVASVGLLTRYQRGRAVGGAPEVGFLGGASNMEINFRLVPTITASFFVEGGLTPLPYATQRNLGVLSDASELRLRAKLTFHLYKDVSFDLGYDFTRWHASFTGSTILENAKPDQALLVESREHAIFLGLRFQ